MEDNIQIFVGIIISVFLFFVFPVYMAYEKLDDVAYVLTMRYTQDFVDNVRSRGYITKDMYEDYKAKLRATGNSYDIDLTHRKTRMDPMSQKYAYSDGKYTLIDTGAQGTLTGSGVVNTYLLEEEVYTTKDIEAVLNTENKLWLTATTDNFTCIDYDEEEDLVSPHKKVKGCQYAYTMNENDNFNVIIRNTNTTVATAIYNMITVNTVDNNTRIYVNYGGTILSEKWFGKIDYKKMKHDDNLNLIKKAQQLIFSESKEFDGAGMSYATLDGHQENDEEYILEFEAKPLKITELRPVGYTPTDEEDDKYNLAFGTSANSAGIQISIGLNGVTALYQNGHVAQVILSYPIHISGYKKFRIEVSKVITSPQDWKLVLYIDDKKVDESIYFRNYTQITKVGGGHLKYGVTRYFEGYIRNLYIYK